MISKSLYCDFNNGDKYEHTVIKLFNNKTIINNK